MVDDDARCVCGHQRDAHEHYRSGTDCALCSPRVCPRFRPGRWRRVLGAVRSLPGSSSAPQG